MWTRCRIEPNFFKTVVFRRTNHQLAFWTDLLDLQSAHQSGPADSPWSALVGELRDFSHSVRASSVMHFQAWFGSGESRFPGIRQTSFSGLPLQTCILSQSFLRGSGWVRYFGGVWPTAALLRFRFAGAFVSGTMSRPVPEVSNLCTSFHAEECVVKAVDEVSFRIELGCTLGIVDESGSGKSVTSFSIMKLLAATARV